MAVTETMPSSDSDGDLVLLALHLRWLYDVVLRERVRDTDFAARFIDGLCKTCESVETHGGGAGSLFRSHPELQSLLCDGVLYVYAAEVVFAELPPTLAQFLAGASRKDSGQQTMSLVLRWLSNCHSLDLGDATLNEWASALADRESFRADLHNVLAGFLLYHYCYTFLQPADVLSHVSSFVTATDEDARVSESLEGSLLCWINRVCGLFSSTTDVWVAPGQDLYDAVADGRLLNIVFFKYDTGFIAIQSVHLKEGLSEAERVSNWAVLLDACRRSRINPPFTAEEAVLHADRLRLPILWLVQSCHNVLRRTSEGVLGGSALTSDAAEAVHIRPPSRMPVCADNRYDPCGAGSVPGTPVQWASQTVSEQSESPARPLPGCPPKVLRLVRAGPSDPLGIEFSDPFAAPVVVAVREGLPGAAAGFRVGQQIVAVNGRAVSSGVEVARMVDGMLSMAVTVAGEAHADPQRVSFVRASMRLLESPGGSSDGGQPAQEVHADLMPLCKAAAGLPSPGRWRKAVAAGVASAAHAIESPDPFATLRREGPSPPSARCSADWTSTPRSAAVASTVPPPSCAGADRPATAAGSPSASAVGTPAPTERRSPTPGLTPPPGSARSSPDPAADAADASTPRSPGAASGRCEEEAAEEQSSTAAAAECSPAACSPPVCSASVAASPAACSPAPCSPAACSPAPCSPAACSPAPCSPAACSPNASCGSALCSRDASCSPAPCSPAACSPAASCSPAACSPAACSPAACSPAACSPDAARSPSTYSPAACSPAPVVSEAGVAEPSAPGSAPGSPPSPPADDPPPSPPTLPRGVRVSVCGRDGSVGSVQLPSPRVSLTSVTSSGSGRLPHTRPRTPRIAGARPLQDLGYEPPQRPADDSDADPIPEGTVPAAPGPCVTDAGNVCVLEAENAKIDHAYQALLLQRDRVIERLRRRSARRAASRSPPPPVLRQRQQQHAPVEVLAEAKAAAPGKENCPPRRTPPKRHEAAVPADNAAMLAMASRSRQHAANALRHLCLPGRINAGAMAEVTAAMDEALSAAGDRQKEVRFVLHVKGPTQPLLKSVYASRPSDAALRKVYGCGPRHLTSKLPGCAMSCLKYDSSAKRFAELPGSFGVEEPLVDAVVLSRTGAAAHTPESRLP